jgi:hypothetical protein
MIRHLVPDIPSHMPRLPADIALQLPQGQRLGSANAPVKLAFSHWSSIARLKAGQIGALAEDYVEGKLQLEGAMRDVMRAVTKLLPGKPRPGAKRHRLVDPACCAAPSPSPRIPMPGCGADPVPLRRLRRLLRAVAGPAARLFLRLLPR